MNNIDTLNLKLENILEKINDDSMNYVANIQFFEAEGSAGEKAENIIKKALGSSALLGRTSTATEKEVIDELKQGLEYAGSEGAYPNKKYVGSEKHKNEVKAILKEVRNFTSTSSQIIGFWLKEGHPFYPVFWDFAFIIEQGKNAYVFIGSSSD